MADREFTIGSLFSGIGGLELGLEWAGLGPTLWQVEQNAFCRAVLAKHWPETERFTDVKTVGHANLAPVDLICGGFPCQDLSSAGKGAGLTGERSGLWRQYARIIDELRPRWAVVENVTSGAVRWVDKVVGELEELGYACLLVPVSARDVGAPHIRKRLFIVAHADGVPVRKQRRRSEPGPDAAVTGDDGAHGIAPNVDGKRELQPQGDEPNQRRRASNCAASNSAELGRGQGRQYLRPRKPDLAGNAQNAAHAHDSRREGSGPGEQVEGRPGPSSHSWRSPEPGVVPLVHGLSGGLAGRRRRARIRALGNAVVPQCAEVVGWVIRELEAERGAA